MSVSAYINKCISVINSAFKSGDKVEQRRARANLNPAICSTLQLSLLMWRRRTCICWCCSLTLVQHLIQSTHSIQYANRDSWASAYPCTTGCLTLSLRDHSPSASLPSVWALPRDVYSVPPAARSDTTVVVLTRDDYNLAYWQLQWSQQPDASGYSSTCTSWGDWRDPTCSRPSWVHSTGVLEYVCSVADWSYVRRVVRTAEKCMGSPINFVQDSARQSGVSPCQKHHPRCLTTLP